MNSLIISFNAVAPLFLIIFLGYFIKKLNMINGDEVKRMNKVCFYTFMPIMLFYDVYHSDLAVAMRPSYMLFTVAVLLGLTALSTLLVMWLEKDNSCRGVMIQAAYRSNFVLLGLPIAQAVTPAGTQMGTTALMIAVVVPVFNVMGVVILESFRGGRVRLGETLLNIVKNPLIIAATLGLLLNLWGVELPQFVVSFAARMESACMGLALFLLGAAFELHFVADYKKDLAICLLLRLVIFPGVVLGLAALLGIRGLEFVTLLALFAAPTAINSFNMAMQMGGNKDLAASAVMTSTALSCFTLFGWVTVFNWLGMF